MSQQVEKQDIAEDPKPIASLFATDATATVSLIPLTVAGLQQFKVNAFADNSEDCARHK
jgi:hypothetical protein